MLETERLERILDAGVSSWHQVGVDDLAKAAGLSRMTLHRRGITKDVIANGLVELLVAEYQTASLPALVDSEPAAERLRLALEGFCMVNERFLGVMDALGDRVADIFHEPSGDEVLTQPYFTGALRRILEDGTLDGSLVVPGDVTETATLLFNATTWTYQHMRVGHRWSPEKASEQVVTLLVGGLTA